MSWNEAYEKRMAEHEDQLAIEKKCSVCDGTGRDYGVCYTCKGTGYELTELGERVIVAVRRRLMSE